MFTHISNESVVIKSDSHVALRWVGVWKVVV